MNDVCHQRGQVTHHQKLSNEPLAHRVMKAAIAVFVSGSLLILSGLTLVGIVIALVVATPLLVIFSPVLVPAVVTIFLLVTGFVTSGGFGLAAATVFAWIYRYVTREGRTGEGSLDQTGHGMGSKGRGRDVHATGKGHHATGGVQLTTGARAGLYKS
ncbi:oleosin L-like [Bidens hawaiensis]|uniref:oleosin L-like n=1 Tax=Bidens hawaiensis TaxID=980011 RepID=UPI00404952B2